jgi:hypothetical protein
MSAACIGQPISWLRLERYQLGELAQAERDAIAEHLQRCAACAGCLTRIERDHAMALPPLPEARPTERAVRLDRPLLGPRVLVRVRSPRTWGTLVGTLAAAAAVILWLRGDQAGPSTSTGERVKGEAIAFSLVRDDGVRVGDAAGVYRRGDRFKALVTCPPGTSGSFDLAIYDSAGASFPLAAAESLSCGNDIPLPGAFRLTGPGDETVCLVWNPGGAVDRSRLASTPSETDAAERALCKTLAADTEQR